MRRGNAAATAALPSDGYGAMLRLCIGCDGDARRCIDMTSSYCPRLSEARHLLPLLRLHLAAAAAHFPLSAGLTLDLIPMVEDGLFGYEIIPGRETHTYLSLGCDAEGVPMLRKTSYGSGQTAVRLVAIDGQLLSRAERVARCSAQQREMRFADFDAAAEAAMAQLLTLFPERPRQPVTLIDGGNRSLDGALAIAHSHLLRWNPAIHFCGLPDEAIQGFALRGSQGEHGELILQRPDIWILRWKTAIDAVYESWSVANSDADTAGRRDLAS